jgi:hypothetical protein
MRNGAAKLNLDFIGIVFVDIVVDAQAPAQHARRSRAGEPQRILRDVRNQ